MADGRDYNLQNSSGNINKNINKNNSTNIRDLRAVSAIDSYFADEAELKFMKRAKLRKEAGTHALPKSRMEEEVEKQLLKLKTLKAASDGTDTSADSHVREKSKLMLELLIYENGGDNSLFNIASKLADEVLFQESKAHSRRFMSAPVSYKEEADGKLVTTSKADEFIGAFFGRAAPVP